MSACDTRGWLDRTAAVNRSTTRGRGAHRNENSQWDGYISGDEDGLSSSKASPNNSVNKKSKLLRTERLEQDSMKDKVTDLVRDEIKANLLTNGVEIEHNNAEENGTEIDTSQTNGINCGKPVYNGVDEDSSENVFETELCYKPLDESEPVTANSQETGEDLNRPIEEFSGSLLLPDRSKGGLVGGLDFLYEPAKTETLKAEHSSVENLSDYIPEAQQADEGNINLIGIKHRRNSETVIGRRHKTTSKFDQQEADCVDSGKEDNFGELLAENVLGDEPYGGARPKCPAYKTGSNSHPEFSRRIRHRSPVRSKENQTRPPSANFTDQQSQDKLQMKTELDAIIRAAGSSCESEPDTALASGMQVGTEENAVYVLYYIVVLVL